MSTGSAVTGAAGGAAAGTQIMPGWGTAIGAGVGLLAGLMSPDEQTQTKKVQVAPASAWENQGQSLQQSTLPGITAGLSGLPGQEQLNKEAFGASNDFAALLKQYQTTGGMPNQQDIGFGQSYAQQITAPQQQQMNLAMRNSRQQYATNAGIQGRGINDFAMNNRLNMQAQDFAQSLGAQQQSIGAQYAQQISQNRLGFSGQLAELKTGLASQAMQNRMAIMGLGSQIQNQERNARIAQAGGSITNYSPATPLSGLTGMFAGANAGMQLSNMFGSSTGGGVNNGAAPSFQSMAFQAPSFGSSATQQNYLMGNGGGGSPVSKFAAPTATTSSSYTPFNQTQMDSIMSSRFPSNSVPLSPMQNIPTGFPNQGLDISNSFYSANMPPK